MASYKFFPSLPEVILRFIFLTLAITSAAAARILDEELAVPTSSSGVTDSVVTSASNAILPVAAVPAAGTSAVAGTKDSHHMLSFFMNDIFGGSNPSVRAVTGIVSNPAVNGEVPFAEPNSAALPVDNGVPVNNNNNGIINNNNLPFVTGLGGNVANVIQNNGNNINGGFGIPPLDGAQLPSGTTIQKLMLGTMTVTDDDELLEGHDLGSGLISEAQGFYVASSVDVNSQTMAFTAMFEDRGYADSISFFSIHQSAVSESQLAIMGGTGKYVNAKGFATVKTFPATFQYNTDRVETLLQFTVYLAH